ncbi:hypothetical protein Droror1_Dr00026878 [Drosera rotundifolia]
MAASALASTLTHTLCTVPPSAIPALLDCVLASTGASPSLLFESLLIDFEHLITEMTASVIGELGVEEGKRVLSWFCALCHLVKKSGDFHVPLKSFIWKAFVPSMKILQFHGRGTITEIIRSFCDVVIEIKSWQSIEATLASFLRRSIYLSMGVDQNKVSAALDGRSNDSDVHGLGWKTCETNAVLDNTFPLPEPLPLYISCHILTHLLEAALQSGHTKKNTLGYVAEYGHDGVHFSQNFLWGIYDLTIQMISQGAEHQSCAVSLLLPAIFKAHSSFLFFEESVRGVELEISRNEFFMQIWECCRMLFSMGSTDRRAAFSILSLYLSYFPCATPSDDVDMENRVDRFNISAENKLWKEIRKGLLEKECLVRKQSLYILKKILSINGDTEPNSDLVEKRPGHKASVLRGRRKKDLWAEKEAKSMGIDKLSIAMDPCLDKRQKWVAFLLLYEMLEEYGTHLVEAAWNHQFNVLLHSSYHIDSSVNQGEVDAVKDAFGLDILWQRGLSHDNPLVRILIMQSFLDIEWKNLGNLEELFSQSFVLGPFVEGLNDTAHHKDFGVKGVYFSKTIEGSSRFLCQYCTFLTRRKKVTFLRDLASVAKLQSLGRAGLMSLAEIIFSASMSPLACNDVSKSNSKSNGIYFAHEHGAGEMGCPEPSTFKEKEEFMDSLRFVVDSSKQQFNPKYRQRVCTRAFEAASSIICTHELPLEIILHFLSSLPRELSDVGGPLRADVQKWLLGCGKKHCRANCSEYEMKLVQNLCNFPLRFCADDSSVNSSDFDEGDLVAWRSEFEKWARVLLILKNGGKHLEPLFKFIKAEGGNINQQNRQLDIVPTKFLLLLLSLIHELQILQRRPNHGVPKEVDLAKTSLTSLVQKFADTFNMILPELVSFASFACSIFWAAVVGEETRLSGSITGKLGGPSQRRLSSNLATSVLQGIVSIRAVSSVSSWCLLSRNDSISFSLTFLWDFFNKVVSNPLTASEAVAEMRLATYEALSYVLKALVPIFSASTMNLIQQINVALLPMAKDKPLLDSLVLSFLTHINDLLRIGVFARSRIAVLLSWKWLCLEYVLLIPHHAIENGVNLGCNGSFFSDAAIRCIFDDLVGCLENAGEDSILPMLRSVRTVLDLLTSGSPFVSSCHGVDVQMMWQLVRSSWIVYCSFNKRRVAPIAALLSSVIHCNVFRNENMHVDDNAIGPLKWFLEKLIEEGTKSPRTIRLVALHLAGLWQLYPWSIKHYLKELKVLTLYGSVAFDEDFEAELTENDDTRAEVSLLAKNPDPELTEAFINTELYARVCIAVLFYKLGDMAEMARLQEELYTFHAAAESGKLFLLELLHSVMNDKDLSKELYKKYSAIHRRKVRVWQMLCVLSRFVDQEIVQQVMETLHILLCMNNLPGVRQYMETFAIHVYLKFPELVGIQLVQIFHDYEMRTQALSSYVFIAANVILHANKAIRYRHLAELLPPMVPFLTSHHHTLRGFTQLLVYQVLSQMLTALDSGCAESISLEKKCFNDLRSYLASNPDCARLRASMEGHLDAFSPEKSITPAGIFSNRTEALEFECVPMSLMEQVVIFLNDAREELRCSMAKDGVTIRNESLLFTLNPNHKNGSATTSKEVVSFPHDSLSVDFQKKFIHGKHEIQEVRDGYSFNHEKHSPLPEMEDEDKLLIETLHSRFTSMEQLKANRQHIIVVASLIDRIPNLAGLARTCEVFKAAGLAIADAGVLNDKQFQLISVTAEKWIPIIEVPVNYMKTYLVKKKKEGFSVLGLEQTANSVKLDKYEFPKRTVLVLGREKEGIPVDIIHVLDTCIEIPQLGVVRSLNVHVSGAIALWEYTRQQRFE